MTNPILSRLKWLRDAMRRAGVQAYIIPSADPHGSEYPPAYWQQRQWISGFDGSAGTAVVTLDRAALWTDSRYFIAAEAQLRGTSYELMKERVEGTPTIAQWLCRQLKSGDSVGIDERVLTTSEVNALRPCLTSAGIGLNAVDLISSIWQDRPTLPKDPVRIQPLKYAGVSMRDKIAKVRQAIRQQGADCMLVGALDEIAWLLNLRGTDVACNPVFVSFCLVGPHTILYIDRDKLTPEVADYLTGEGVSVKPYEAAYDDISALQGQRLLLPRDINAHISSLVPSQEAVVYAESPIAHLKAVKCEAEIAGFHQAMLRDGVAMVEFLSWLRSAVAAGGQTEISVSDKLESLRTRQPLYRGLSFATIAGYQAHGAIVHYEATPQTDAALKPEGLLLLDSGAQYDDGTTDITRTIALGRPTPLEKQVYTLALKGHIALSRCKFPQGASGTQLDLAARYDMWQAGYNFGHGTGHGVGSCLCVHEGPHQIRMNYMPAPIQEGMTVTDEPGLYLEGQFGVRIENTLLCVPYKETPFGKFVGFEPLTLCPIDTLPIKRSMLTETETEWLDSYHAHVRAQLLPLISDPDVREWLMAATRPLAQIPEA